MKALILLTLFSSLTLFASAQTANIKGLSVVQSTTEQKPTGKTYALVVGISKYKSNEIPSLQFADKDANAFANYLVASGVDSANITLLTNENATYFNVMSELNSICTEKAKQGDKVFFYFSGHGDVESKVITKDGYLLPYDAPKIVYAISAMKVSDVQSYLATASANGVQVYLITDACHAGNLAGGSDGMKNIANVLQEKWKDEVKILSCQPGELSLEGKQWGEGRGLFSYELINGLAGMADKNHDRKVTLHELNLYLEDRVHEGALPSHQNPLSVGNPEKELTTVNEKYLKNISHNQNTNSFAAVDSRGMEEALLKNQTDSVKKWYGLYKIAMDSGYTLFKKGLEWHQKQFVKKKIYYSAYECINKIHENDLNSTLLGLMKRNLVAKMIDIILDRTKSILTNETYQPNGCYMLQIFVDESSELKELIGEKKVEDLGILPILQYSKLTSSNKFIDEFLDDSISKNQIENLVKEYPFASYASGFFSYQLKKANKFSQSKQYAIQSYKYSPKYAYSLVDLMDDYLFLNKPDSSIYYANILENIENEILLHKENSKDNNLKDFRKYLHASVYYKKALAYHLLNNSDSAKFYFKKHDILFNDSNNSHIRDIADLEFTLKNYDASINKFLQILSKMKLVDKKEFAEVHTPNSVSSSNITDYSDLCFQIACCYCNLNKNDSSLFYLEKSIKAALLNFKYTKRDPKIRYYADILNEAFHDCNHVPLDENLDKIRSTPEFKSLLKKYFPNEYKEK